MLDNIFDAVKGQVVNTITEKTGLDMGQAEQTVPVAKESITEGIMGAVTGGNVDGVLNMLRGATGGGGGGMMQNMVYQGIASSFVSKLTSKLRIGEGIASKVSGFALPLLLGKLGSATQEAGDSDGIDASSLMSLVGGAGGAAGMLGKLGGMMGGGDKEDKDGGGGGLLGGLGGMLK